MTISPQACLADPPIQALYANGLNPAQPRPVPLAFGSE